MISTRGAACIGSAIAAGVLAAGLGIAAGPAGAQPVSACGDHALIVTASHIQGATGHGNLILRFENRSHHSCSLRGYPGVTAKTKEGQTLKHAKHTVNGFTGGSRHGVQTIVVRPGHFASADLEWHNFNFHTGHNCRFAPYLEVRPAHTTLTAVHKRDVSLCALQVHPTVAGRSGNG
jgi:hypothetical protein